MPASSNLVVNTVAVVSHKRHAASQSAPSDFLTPPSFPPQLGPLQTFGELALDNPDCRRRASVVAAEDCTLVSITADEYILVQVCVGSISLHTCHPVPSSKRTACVCVRLVCRRTGVLNKCSACAQAWNGAQCFGRGRGMCCMS